MKNHFHSLPSAGAKSAFLICLAAIFVFATRTQSYAQGCLLTCEGLTVVEVAANSTYELLPADLADGDLATSCPNGVLQTQAQINSVWQPAMGNMVFDESHIGQTIFCRIFDEISTNSCWGNVQVVAATPALDTIRFQLCAEFWENNQPIKGATLIFQPNNPAFPYSPIIYSLDTSQNCTELTVVLSDYLPGTTFGYTASLPNTNHLNGVSVVDMCLINRYILGISPLPSPYSLIAADANKSGSITTFDLVEIKKLLQGVYDSLPNNNAWRFTPDYCVFPNPNNPFQSPCPLGINDLELSALDGGLAKVTGMKIGDVDGDARLNGEPYSSPLVNDSITMLLPQGSLAAGASVAIPVKFDKDFTLGNLQAQFFIDPALARYDSISDALMDVFSPSFAFYDTLTGHLKFISSGYFNFLVPAGAPLFYIHLSTLQSANLNNLLKVVQDDPEWKTFASGSDCSFNYTIGATYTGFVPVNSPDLRGLRVQSPSPNPFTEQTFLEIELESAETAFLEVSDMTGRILFLEEKNLAEGVTRWEIPASAISSGSLAIWRLRIGAQMVSGKLARN